MSKTLKVIENTKMITQIELQLPSGEKVLLSDTVIAEITNHIHMGLMTKCMVNGKFVMYNVSDSSVKKSQELYRIVTEQKDMDSELRSEYFKAILELMKQENALEMEKVMEYADGVDKLKQ